MNFKPSDYYRYFASETTGILIKALQTLERDYREGIPWESLCPKTQAYLGAHVDLLPITFRSDLHKCQETGKDSIPLSFIFALAQEIYYLWRNLVIQHVKTVIDDRESWDRLHGITTRPIFHKIQPILLMRSYHTLSNTPYEVLLHIMNLQPIEPSFYEALSWSEDDFEVISSNLNALYQDMVKYGFLGKDQDISEIRSFLHGLTPSQQNFEDVCDLMASCSIREDYKEVILPYIQGILSQWPSEYKYVEVVQLGPGLELVESLWMYGNQLMYSNFLPDQLQTLEIEVRLKTTLDIPEEIYVPHLILSGEGLNPTNLHTIQDALSFEKISYGKYTGDLKPLIKAFPTIEPLD